MGEPTNIIDKIRKLMAIADKNSGATEAEMASAANFASMLMMKHQISEDKLARPGTVSEKRTQDYNLQAWYSVAANAAASLNMCQSLMYMRRRDKKVQYAFVGRPEATQAAVIVFEQLIKEVNRLFKLLKPDPLPSIAWRVNFKLGCATRISSRVQRMLDEMRNDDLKAMEGTGSRALVVAATIDQRLAEAKAWMDEEFGELKAARKKGPRIGETAGAFHAGSKAGDQAIINKQVKK